MKVYISVDIEGVSGVVHGEQTTQSGYDYEYARQLMTNEANAAIKGAVNAGADEIIVNDSHGSMRNIYIDSLSNKAKLISGSPKRLAMMEGIDKSYDAAIFVGYHTRSGSQGILNHTYSGKVINDIKVNDKSYGEFGLNALIAGVYEVPVVFVSGCDLLTNEAIDSIDNITTAEVKRTINQVVSENLHPTESCKLIEEGVYNALNSINQVKVFTLETENYKFDVSFLKTLSADIAETLPMVEKTSDATVRFQTSSFIDGFLITRALIMMASNYAK